MPYLYRLASNKIKKGPCPQCQSKAHWQRYLCINTGEALPEKYGRCDNSIKCGHWIDPNKDKFLLREIPAGRGDISLPDQEKAAKSIVVKGWMPSRLLEKLNGNFEMNTFYQGLMACKAANIPEDEILSVFKLYRVGTIPSGRAQGDCAFPFIDRENVLRTIQTKRFNIDCHTVNTDFLHDIYKRRLENYRNKKPKWLEEYLRAESKVSCLFGEHLLEVFPKNRIGIVEAPKSAMIATIYFGHPRKQSHFLWLSCYSLTGLTVSRCQALKGREVVLFPDLSKPAAGKETAFEYWKRKMSELQQVFPTSQFLIDDFLEKNADDVDRQFGADLADFLLGMDWRTFQQAKI